MTAPAAPGKRPSFADWRNWRLPVKFLAVTLVPVLFAIVLGVSQIRWQVEQSDEYHRVADVLDTAQRVEPLVEALQRERNSAVLSITGQQTDFQQASSDVDAAIKAVDNEIGDPMTYGSVVADRHREMHAALAKLTQTRPLIARGLAPAPQVIEGYGTTIGTVLSMDRALTSTVSEPSLSSTAAALQDMLGMMEEVRVQQAWVLSGLSKGSLTPEAVDALQGSRARLIAKITEARSTVARHWQQRLDATVAGEAITRRNQMLTVIIGATLDDESSGGYPVSAQQWNAVSDEVVNLIDDGHNDLADEVRAGAARLEDDASSSAGWDSTMLLAGLVLAAAVMITVSRQMLGSLRDLRRGALDAAQRELPAAVDSARSGGETTDPQPVPVHTTEEVGQVARAFDEVQRQALRLAAEQAILRHGYSESFVGVSRRSQSLLERQLRLFEQLEQDEEDPDQLSRLFQLDHLATRMRRNNENLMVLSGHDLARRFVRPTDLADVLRAAVSEIEQYPRVVVQPPPQVKLLGHAASDLVRLLAELMDNAANFSSPDTGVTVSSYQAGDGSVTVDVLDEGIGMGEAELAEANRQLSQVDENDLATSRRMGLFVVARLAVRHGVQVRLFGGPDVEGVRATAVIPAEHVVGGGQQQGGPAGSTPTPAQGGQRNGFAHHDMPTSGSLAPAQSGAAQAAIDDTGFSFGGPDASTGFSAAETGFQTAPGADTGFSTGGERGFSTGETGFSTGESGFSTGETGFSTGGGETGFSTGGAEGFSTGGGETGFSTGSQSGDNTFNTGFFTANGEKVGDGSPLPRRDPSAGLPLGQRRDPGEGLGGLGGSAPADPSEAPTQSLFTPIDLPEQPDAAEHQAEWSSSGLAWPPAIEDSQPSRESVDETPSPIFEEVSTQWFTPATEAEPEQDSGSWAFPPDAAAEAEAASDARGSSELPRRETRGGAEDELRIDESDPLGIDHLAGGSGAAAQSADGAEGEGDASRSPHELSRRLADLQGGLRFGRKGPVQSQDTEQDAPPRQSADQHGATADSGSSAGEGWSFATDDAWKQAEAATNYNPTSFTASGLPRRTPKAQLAPGSAGSFFGDGQGEDKPFSRDADALRGRLSSFQSGVQRGRHRLDES